VTWSPRWRRGTPEQTAAYRQAHTDLFRNGRYEEKAAIRGETPRFLDLNERAWHTCAPLNPAQRWWHWQRAAVTEDREFGRLQRAAGQQDRSRRRSR
jgi:hypothetical protein